MAGKMDSRATVNSTQSDEHVKWDGRSCDDGERNFSEIEDEAVQLLAMDQISSPVAVVGKDTTGRMTLEPNLSREDACALSNTNAAGSCSVQRFDKTKQDDATGSSHNMDSCNNKRQRMYDSVSKARSSDDTMCNENTASSENHSSDHCPSKFECQQIISTQRSACPDINNFESYKDANRFAVGQIWALYDKFDAMPRSYARIVHFDAHNKIHLSWLEHDATNKEEEKWTDKNLPVACGSFRLQPTVDTSQDRSIFSHTVAWTKGTKGNSYDIYPNRGEVWALYKGWSMQWSSDTDNYRSKEYVVVEVLSTMSADDGATVIPLVKIKDFVSLFARSKGMPSFFIPSSELLRFSHSISFYRTNGNEKIGVPRGFLELDTACLPADLDAAFSSVTLVSYMFLSSMTGCVFADFTTKSVDNKMDYGDERIARKENPLEENVCHSISTDDTDDISSEQNTSKQKKAHDEVLNSPKMQDRDFRSFMAFYKSPSKEPEAGKDSALPTDAENVEDWNEDGNVDNAAESEDELDQSDDSDENVDNAPEEEDEQEQDASYDTDDSEDEDYKQPIEEDSSASDEEYKELRNFAAQIKKNIKAKKLGNQGQVGEIRIEDLVDEVQNFDDPGSPYLDSDDDYSYEEDSDGETVRWKSCENKFDSKAPVPVFTLGMAFRDSRQFKKALVKYGLKAHKSLKFPKDEKNKVKAVCDWVGCEWFIYGSKTSRSKWFKVVTFNDEHSCPPRRDNRLVTSSLIAKHYYHQIKDNPTWKTGLMKAAVLKDLCADVSISKCKKAKALVLQKALNAMQGEYIRVFDYQLELQRSNPGTTVVVCLDPEVEDKHIFQRLYVCFDALKKGFKAGCRKVIGLDGCWFKGAHNGNLLCAVGRDANNQMYPVAWAAVPIENYDTWYWFLSLLQKDLSIQEEGEGWVIISDQQKGLLKAVKELVPHAEHRMCARHIYDNWRKHYTDKKLQKKWWRCAKASSKTLFNLYRAYLAQDTPEGARDMMNTSPEHWSRAFFKVGSYCDSVDNNMCESFNNSIMEARFFPVISMCEAIRKKIMVRIQENRTRAERWTGNICPNVFKKLKMNIELSARCDVLWNGADGYEVQEKEDRKYIVRLMTGECTCRYWQLSGLPCCHAISCIYKSSQKLEDFIAPCYSIQAYNQTYAHVLQPVEGKANWPISDMPRPEPPAYVKMPGRPKTQRKREEWEQPKGKKLSKVGIKMRCRLCGNTGHNARRCSKNPEAGNKKNAAVKRVKNKKRKNPEVGTSSATAPNPSQQTRSKKTNSTARTSASQPS